MTIQDFYASISGNYDEACTRLINDRLVERFVLKFPTDPSMQKLREAVADGDIKASFRAVHTLKGVCGNLAFTRLYKAAWDLVEQLRPQTEQADARLLEIVENEYQATIAAIEKYQS